MLRTLFSWPVTLFQFCHQSQNLPQNRPCTTFTLAILQKLQVRSRESSNQLQHFRHVSVRLSFPWALKFMLICWSRKSRTMILMSGWSILDGLEVDMESEREFPFRTLRTSLTRFMMAGFLTLSSKPFQFSTFPIQRVSTVLTVRSWTQLTHGKINNNIMKPSERWHKCSTKTSKGTTVSHRIQSRLEPQLYDVSCSLLYLNFSVFDFWIN